MILFSKQVKSASIRSPVVASNKPTLNGGLGGCNPAAGMSLLQLMCWLKVNDISSPTWYTPSDGWGTPISDGGWRSITPFITCEYPSLSEASAKHVVKALSSYSPSCNPLVFQ